MCRRRGDLCEAPWSPRRRAAQRAGGVGGIWWGGMYGVGLERGVGWGWSADLSDCGDRLAVLVALRDFVTTEIFEEFAELLPT